MKNGSPVMTFPEKKRHEEKAKSPPQMVATFKKLKMEVSSQESSSDYVLMPWDDTTTIIVSEGDNLMQSYLRWELIQKQLSSTQILNVEDLIQVIKSYNVVFEKNGKQKKPSWKCVVLRQYFAQLDELEKKEFFEENGVLSTIRNLSLQLKELVPQLKLLKTGSNSSIRLHQMQVASILCHSFFCTFPEGNVDCPSINFITLYEGPSGSFSKNYLEKLKCLMHYFKRIHLKQPSGNLSFHRLSIPDHKFPRWDKTSANLCSLKVDAEGKIEDQMGFLQMDFANKYVGGGVLGRGCVQEEIRFLISSELIATRLFTECLADNEALLVVGAERYCHYKGYANTFAFVGNFEDTTPYDENRRRKTYLIVIDALYFRYSSEQYRESKILRELKKAYVGFKQSEEFKGLPLATGNWGCGAFGGDPQLKTLLQLMASSQAQRDMLYLTFGNPVLKNQIEEIYALLKKKATNVGMLYRIIRLYNRERERNQTVFDFVITAMNRMEKLPKSIPSTSKNNYDTEFSSKDKCRGDFEEVQKNSKTVPSESFYSNVSPAQSSGQSVLSEECTNILDKIWYENELDSNSSVKKREEETVDTKSQNRKDSFSLFSDEEIEGSQENTKKNCNFESSSGTDNRCQTSKSLNKEVHEFIRTPQYKKVKQTKITDCFFKK